MKLYYDFHIHTALSPCADMDMTPNNIVNMALLKGLDAIAVTDHNACGNVEAVMKAAAETELLVIGGMELECAEEVHAVCLFPCLEQLKRFESLVKESMPKIKNKENIFGRQVFYNELDEETGTFEHMLAIASQISFDDAFKIVSDMSGILIPAHIDRPSNSIISNLGFIPDYLPITSIELSKNYKDGTLDLNGYRIIRSSDAHYLENINERINFIDIDFTPDSERLINFLKTKMVVDTSEEMK